MLSGLKNRNSFIRFAQQIEKRGDSVSVMVCDIDGLKIINDTLGHLAGDEIIRKPAAVLQDTCPNNATIFRMGGDKFLVIIQEALSIRVLENLHDSIKSNIAIYNSQ